MILRLEINEYDAGIYQVDADEREAIKDKIIELIGTCIVAGTASEIFSYSRPVLIDGTSAPDELIELKGAIFKPVKALRVAGSVPASSTQVPSAQVALYHIREVTSLEDACTEELQRMLDDHWHILSILAPTPPARRPDYVLGR